MDKKLKILNAAREEFCEKGFIEASISGITKRAEVNNAMVNYYFGSKQRLYQKVLLSFVNANILQQLNKYYKKLEKHHLDVAQNLFCRIYVKVPLVTIRNEKVGKFLFREFLSNRPESKKFFHQLLKDISNDSLSIVKKGIQQGVFECSNPEHLLISEHLTALFIHFLPLIDAKDVLKPLSKMDLNSIRDNTLERIFKSLAVSGRPIYPQIPESLKREMDNFVEQLIDEGGLYL